LEPQDEYDYYSTERQVEVYETIEKTNRDISIKEISDKLELNRDTVAKYVKVLKNTGRLKVTRKVGNAIFYDTK